ncbi:MAG: adenylate/guanylate cyclase domain-containing protein, partial [Bacteroidota bacterium]|nr:adenylate/guanylate cyclase domain-containing protein [Bacteroidota bacterium]
NHSVFGLVKYTNSEFKKLPNGKYFIGKDILDILPFNKSILIKVNSISGLLEYDFQEIKKIPTQVDTLFDRLNYSDGIVLSDSSIAFGTSDKGIVVMDRKGKIVFHLNKSNGLNDNSIYCLYKDMSGNLWASLRNGISKINYPNPFTFYESSSGLEGGVLSLARFDGKLFVGTLSGAYVLNHPFEEGVSSFATVKKSFSQIEGISAVVYQLVTFRNKLYAISDHGLYLILGNKSEVVYNQPLRCALVSKKHPDLLFVGGNFGFTALKFNNGAFIDLGKLKKINHPIRTIAEDSNGDIWLGSNNYGAYRILSSGKYNQKMRVTKFDDNFLLPINHSWVDVYSTRLGMLFSSQSGLLRFNPKVPGFYQDTLLKISAGGKDRWVYPIVEDQFGNIVMSRGSNETFKKETKVAFYDSTSNLYNLVEARFHNISSFTVETFLPENEKILWIGGADGLIRFNLDDVKKDSVDYITIIKGITFGNDSLIPLNSLIDYSLKENKIKIESHFNSMRFDFVCPAFLGDEIMMYKIQLENFDNDWSDWSFDNTKEYNFLKPGKYIFRVKAKSLYGQDVEEANIEFIILAPFYQTIIAYTSYVIFFLIFIVLFLKYRSYQFAKEKNKLEKIIKERTDELLKEIERAEDILVNMLPYQIANELKLKGKASTRKFDLVTVLFTDIQGFTKIAEIIDPDTLVRKLEEFFFSIDNIVEKYSIEKIKTIGDGYMCAGGIPEKNRTNPIEVILAALEIREYMKNFEFDRKKTEHLKWGLRIGIHSGPAIAGVIGTKRYLYDIWGVTVNSASRMESEGKAGRINISGSTYKLVRDYFDCEYHGEFQEKTGTEITMYYVNAIKPEFANDKTGVLPNEKLMFQLFDIRYSDLYDYMIAKLQNELPNNLYYHNLQHTIDVCVQSEIIANSEGVTDEETILLKTAALFHDCGFTKGYENHELNGVKIAREILPHYQYSALQIETICELIMATRIPPNPKNKLEMIICDADLDYLGRRDFIPVSKNLFMELYERKKIKSVDEWLKKQISFIDRHTYFTKTALENRNVNKKQQLENIRQMDFLSSFF